MLAASVLIDYNGRFVIVRHANDPQPGGWTLPGGYAEPGESVDVAASREAKEECGLIVDDLDPVGVVTTTIVSPSEGSLAYYLTIFRGAAIGGEPSPEDRVEIDEVRAAAFPEIESLAAANRFPSINPKLDPAILECLRRTVRA